MPDIPSAPVINPAGYITEHALALSDGTGLGAPVSAANPLPVALATPPATSTALTGTATGTGVAGPFTPILGRAIWVQLNGSWSGTVQVRRSIDGGATTQPLTIGGQPWASFSANANEPIGEESVTGALYYLQITLGSGSVSYRVQQ